MVDKKKNSTDKGKSSLDTSLKDLAELAIEGLKEDHRKEFEADIVYLNQIRSHFYNNFHRFKSRFVKGYEILIEELSNENRKIE
ncbi:MAG: hypothetical protein H0W88_07205 [Parachlamydiaceae bacterium]|nr:hypothetical protein [Parachlamydiaceae bacterium]